MSSVRVPRVLSYIFPAVSRDASPAVTCRTPLSHPTGAAVTVPCSTPNAFIRSTEEDVSNIASEKSTSTEQGQLNPLGSDLVAQPNDVSSLESTTSQSFVDKSVSALASVYQQLFVKTSTSSTSNVSIASSPGCAMNFDSDHALSHSPSVQSHRGISTFKGDTDAASENVNVKSSSVQLTPAECPELISESSTSQQFDSNGSAPTVVSWEAYIPGTPELFSKLKLGDSSYYRRLLGEALSAAGMSSVANKLQPELTNDSDNNVGLAEGSLTEGSIQKAEEEKELKALLRLRQRAALMAAAADEHEVMGRNDPSRHTLQEALLEKHCVVSDYHGVAEDVIRMVGVQEEVEIEHREAEMAAALARTGDLVQPLSVAEVTEKKAVRPATRALSAEEIRVMARRETQDKIALDIRTRSLVKNFVAEGITSSSRHSRLVDLTQHLLTYPQSHPVAIKARLIPGLQSIRKRADERLRGQIRETLALLGQVDPLPTKGLRILSIDGGGTKGLVAIETLRKLERACGGKRVHELFDYVCGVSTGALLAVLVAAHAFTPSECEKAYTMCSQEMFTRSRLLGVSKFLLNQAYYDESKWEAILKQWGGEMSLLSTTKRPDCPKIGLISTVVKEGFIKNYIFRNYRTPAGTISHYPGTAQAQVWEAIRASSAAPGYYGEFKIGDQVHQDGGVLTNNPSAIAVHEAKLLWPNEPIQCVVSLGNGRFEPTEDHGGDSAGSGGGLNTVKTKVHAFVQSATGTEGVHTVLHDLLEPSAYYRFNPYTSEDYGLDEIRSEKLSQMQQEARMYLRRNSLKVEAAASRLMQPRPIARQAKDWVGDTVKGLLS